MHIYFCILPTNNQDVIQCFEGMENHAKAAEAAKQIAGESIEAV